MASGLRPEAFAVLASLRSADRVNSPRRIHSVFFAGSLVAGSAVAVILTACGGGGATQPGATPTPRHDAFVGGHLIIPAAPHRYRGTKPQQYPANNTLSAAGYLSASQIASIAAAIAVRNGSTVSSTTFGTWDPTVKNAGLEPVDPAVSPNRLVYVVTFVHPTSLRSDAGVYAPGATTTTVVDAQTGNVLEGGLRGTLTSRNSAHARRTSP